MPSALDVVFTFRARNRPLTHALFRHENYIEENVPTLPLLHLGRSGFQVQHAFNLLTVEKSPVVERNPWPLRHAAMYHSLDLGTGRAVYLLMKGDTTLAKRIKDATEKSRHLQATVPRTREQSFEASLHVHILMLEWSVESWSEYIDDMEDRIRNHTPNVKVAPMIAPVVAHVARAGHTELEESKRQGSSGFSRRTHLTVRTIATSVAESAPDTSTPRPIHTGINRLAGFLRRLPEGPDNTTQNNDTVEEEQPKPLLDLSELEERFSFSEIQRLSLLSDEINQSILALEQSRQVIIQVEEQYRTVVASHAFRTKLDQNKCKTAIAIFFRRVRSTLHDLDVYRRRLLELSRMVDGDEKMFEFLSQSINIQTSKAFQVMAQKSADEMMKWTLSMHEIAIETKQETLSMHVITVFTLVFLPGTFLATFFSSGVIHWDEDGILGTEWEVRGGAMRLFMAICLPMMAFTIAGWAVMYRVARRRAGRYGQDLGLRGFADERVGSRSDALGDANVATRVQGTDTGAPNGGLV